MAILVTGGAGYIGSVAVERLLAAGDSAVVIDNLVYGHRAAVPDGVAFYEGDIGNRDLVRQVLSENEIDSCMHFSAYAYVGESVKEPQKYFENNFVHTLALLDVLVEKGMDKFVFSSTCATYGEPEYSPMDESHPQSPVNPYGWSKLMVEQALKAYDKAYGLRSVALRYFNAAGATATHGEHHEPETHLIPLSLAVAQGRSDAISIYGDDYPTGDGTAIRDYVHVSDIADAHLLALGHLRSGGASDALNLGNGSGYSVREVVETARRVTGHEIPEVIAGRRAGDPSELVADPSKARNALGWSPKYPELEAIISTAWEWLNVNPDGYPANG